MSNGATIIQDGRVSKGLAWIAGVIGSLLVIALTFCANNLWQLNLTMRDVISENKAFLARLDRADQRDDRQDIDIRDLQRNVATIEGRNLRGGAFGKEEPRGH